MSQTSGEISAIVQTPRKRNFSHYLYCAPGKMCQKGCAIAQSWDLPVFRPVDSLHGSGYSELTRLKTGKFHHCVLAKKAERQTEIAYLCAEGMSFEQIAFWQGRIRIWKVASLKLSFSFILKGPIALRKFYSLVPCVYWQSHFQSFMLSDKS